MNARSRRASIADVHTIAQALPYVRRIGPADRPVYQVGQKSFVYFRTRRPDAYDAETGERFADVIMFWVGEESDKLALVQDPNSPFFTTPHFDSHPSVLIRGSRIKELTRAELAEVIEDAWLAQASPRRRSAWLADHPDGEIS